MFCFLLTACSGGNNAANNTKVNATTEPAATEAAVEATAEATAAPVDMGGRVIKVAAWWDLKPAGNSASEKERLAKIAEVEKKYNCKFEFVNVPFQEFMPKFTATALTGEPFADIVIMEYNSAWPAILKGQLLKVSEYTTAASNINNEANLLVKAPQIANEDYAFAEPGVGGAGIHYNRDLFKNWGFPICRSFMPVDNGIGINSSKSPNKPLRIRIMTVKSTLMDSRAGLSISCVTSPQLMVES